MKIARAANANGSGSEANQAYLCQGLVYRKGVQIDNDEEEKEVTIMKKTKKIVKMTHEREHDLDYT